KTSFTPQEQQELQPLTPAAQREYFFDHWTLKEAYAKARGLGLYLPLREFGFQLQTEREPAIQLRPTAPQADGQDWQFAVLSPTPSHRLALAVQSTQVLQVTLKQGIPGSAAHRLSPSLTYSRGMVLALEASADPKPGL
ncbi:MAG: 4-phosphopantetheinyl transferase family protein, partial [Leptolyngbyaceae cyanobacterium SM2_5_2]|nr:4-phosphopantetheinyl transferase family protein [Leptolyngbyaceae cyanobacterium SM2_5_2]